VSHGLVSDAFGFCRDAELTSELEFDRCSNETATDEKRSHTCPRF